MSSSESDLLLRPVQRMLDRGVRHSSTAAALCEQLEGKTFQIQAGPNEWAAFFMVSNGQLILRQGQTEQADAVLSGSLISLARMAGDDPEVVIRSGAVTISGDADVANDFRALLTVVRPDWEEELSRILGDPIAHEAGRAMRDIRGWAQRTRRSLGRSVAEYLTEESRDLAANAELAEFCADVDKLSQAVDRAEARLQLLRSQQAEQQLQ